jgi:hypothetical protein
MLTFSSEAGYVITSYKCTKEDCPAFEIAVPDARTLRSEDGKGRLCGNCKQPMAIAGTLNVSGGGRRGGSGGRRHRR